MNKVYKILSILFIFMITLCWGSDVSRAEGISLDDVNMELEFHRKQIIKDILKENDVTFNEDWSVSEIIHVIEERLGYQEKARDLIIQIKSVDNAEIIYMSEDGELYSSDEGYLGQAEKVKGVNTITSSHLKNNRQKIISKSKENPTVNEIHGGNTGAFERRQLNFSGFDGIQATVILPYISNLSTGEQPWVYFGFDAPNVIGVEGGYYSYQTGSKTWIPYIRNQNGFQYKSEDAQKKKDGESVHIKFYVKKELDGKIYAS